MQHNGHVVLSTAEVACSSLQMLVLNINFMVLGFDMAVWG
jgi:hypothetical protein